MRNLIEQILNEDSMLTPMVIATLHPEWSIREVYERLGNTEEILKLIEELNAIPDGSINKLEKGDL